MRTVEKSPDKVLKKFSGFLRTVSEITSGNGLRFSAGKNYYLGRKNFPQNSQNEIEIDFTNKPQKPLNMKFTGKFLS